MKNALILHGTDSTSADNWFPWLAHELVRKGYSVWMPDLPSPEKPNIERYNKFLLSNPDYAFNADSLIVGHSSGAVAALGLLEALPADVVIDHAVLVAPFKDDLGWESLSELFKKPLDFKKIREKANLFTIIHSDDDPYCPMEHAVYLAEALHADLRVRHGEKHFSVGTAGEGYRKLPYLLEVIDGKARSGE